MNEMFGEALYRWLLVYLDDILIYSRSHAEHLVHLHRALSLLREHKFFAKLSKCSFGRSAMEFLGHDISASGIRATADKLAAVRLWPVPTTISDLRGFLGMCNYVRRYVKDFASIARPLTTLTSPALPWAWTAAADQSFRDLKAACSSSAVVQPPTPHGTFYVTTDASNFATGAVLEQLQDGERRVIAYDSSKFTPQQANKTAYEKEMLAVLRALHVWRHHLAHQHFHLLCDNAAVTFIQRQPELTPQQARWILRLSEYDYTITHIPGVANVVADALSRRPDLAPTPPSPPPAASSPPAVFLAALSIFDGNRAALDDYVVRAGLSDPSYQALLQQPPSDHTIHDGLLYLRGTATTAARLCVPRGPGRQVLLAEAHDGPSGGHLGRDKVLDRIKRNFYWPGMDSDVAAYVTSCPSCQAHKPANSVPIGLLHPLPVPLTPWESVSLDFTHLPRDTDGHDFALVFVCRLTKMIKICATFTTVTGPQTAQLLVDSLLRHGYGIPTSLVSDRDARFTGQFWGALARILGTKLAMSTAYHPQTDGQTERANRSIKSILLQLTADHGRDWVRHLPLLEFAYNNSVHAATGFSAFFLCHGRHPRLPTTLTSSFPPETSDHANAFAARVSSTIATARKRILAAQERMCVQADRSRRPHTFAVGDFVLLSAADFNQPPFSPRYLGPFAITELVSEVAMRLQLPPSLARRHDVFHVSKLRPFIEDLQFHRQPPELATPSPAPVAAGRYSVREIAGRRKVGRGWQLLVKWEGYPDESDDTWEPLSRMRQDVPALVHAFEMAEQ